MAKTPVAGATSGASHCSGAWADACRSVEADLPALLARRFMCDVLPNAAARSPGRHMRIIDLGPVAVPRWVQPVGRLAQPAQSQRHGLVIQRLPLKTLLLNSVAV